MGKDDFKFSITETIVFDEVQFSVTVTTVPSVKTGSPEYDKMKAKADKVFRLLMQHLRAE